MCYDQEGALLTNTNLLEGLNGSVCLIVKRRSYKSNLWLGWARGTPMGLWPGWSCLQSNSSSAPNSERESLRRDGRVWQAFIPSMWVLWGTHRLDADVLKVTSKASCHRCYVMKRNTLSGLWGSFIIFKVTLIKKHKGTLNAPKIEYGSRVVHVCYVIFPRQAL